MCIGVRSKPSLQTDDTSRRLSCEEVRRQNNALYVMKKHTTSRRRWFWTLCIIIHGLLLNGPLQAKSSAPNDRCPILEGNRQDIFVRRVQDDYERGQFDAVLTKLGAYLDPEQCSDHDPNVEVEAYALLAQTYMALDQLKEARAAVVHLVRLDPAYEPEREATMPFRRMVRRAQSVLARTQTTTVSKTPEDARAAPATVLYLTQEQIQRRGYTDLEALLHDLPGFDISRGNGTLYANIYQRGYRSNGTDRMLLLIDGVEENNIWAFNAYLSRQYPLSNVRRVEVVYGPASTMYGANAFLGVVNVITKDPEDFVGEERTWGVAAQTGLGSWNTRYIDGTVAGLLFNRVPLSVTGRLYYSDEMDLSGFDEWDYQQPRSLADYIKKFEDEDLARRARDLDAQALQQATLNDERVAFSNQTKDWLVNAKLKFDRLLLGFQTWRRDEGSVGWFRDDFRGSAQSGATWIPMQTFFYAKYDHRINRNLSISSLSSYKIHDLADDNATVKLQSYIAGRLDMDDLAAGVKPTWTLEYLHQISKQFRSELKTVYEPRDDLDVVGGIELRSSIIQGNFNQSDTAPARETAQSDMTTTIKGGNHFGSRDIGLFAQAAYAPTRDLKLTLGLRIDNNKIRSNGGYGTVFNSRVGVVYSPGLWIFKGIFAQAFKDADNRTKYAISPGSRDLSNPTLKPERVNNFEGSISRRLGDHLVVDVAGYTAFYNNAVGTRLVPFGEDGDSTRQNENVGKLHISGIQANLDYTYKNYAAYANYTYTNPKNMKPLDKDGNPRNDGSTLRIGDIASHQANVGVNARYFERLNVNLRLNYVGDRRTGQGTTAEENNFDKIDAYTVLNGALSYEVPAPGEFPGRLTAQVVVNNLFDARYFHPGVRSAAGEFAARLPQNERNLTVRLLFQY